jgi:hypothetical protein
MNISRRFGKLVVVQESHVGLLRFYQHSTKRNRRKKKIGQSFYYCGNTGELEE